MYLYGSVFQWLIERSSKLCCLRFCRWVQIYHHLGSCRKEKKSSSESEEMLFFCDKIRIFINLTAEAKSLQANSYVHDVGKVLSFEEWGLNASTVTTTVSCFLPASRCGMEFECLVR